MASAEALEQYARHLLAAALRASPDDERVGRVSAAFCECNKGADPFAWFARLDLACCAAGVSRDDWIAAARAADVSRLLHATPQEGLGLPAPRPPPPPPQPYLASRVRCAKCGGREVAAVAVQQGLRGDEGLKLLYSCQAPACKHSFSGS